jgi:hypothetical protein
MSAETLTYLLPPATIRDWLESKPRGSWQPTPYGEVFVDVWAAAPRALSLRAPGDPIALARQVDVLTRLPQPGDTLPVTITPGTRPEMIEVTGVREDRHGLLFEAVLSTGERVAFGVDALEAAGFDVETLGEPPVGATVRDGEGGYWIRRPNGWHPRDLTSLASLGPTSWRDLNDMFPPVTSANPND